MFRLRANWFVLKLGQGIGRHGSIVSIAAIAVSLNSLSKGSIRPLSA